jgi:hypothetical protein
MEHDIQGEGGQTLQAISQDDGSVVLQASHGAVTISAADAGALGAALQEHAKAEAAKSEPAATEPVEEPVVVPPTLPAPRQPVEFPGTANEA